MCGFRPWVGSLVLWASGCGSNSWRQPEVGLRLLVPNIAMKKELSEALKQSLREAKLIKRGQRWMRRRTHDSRQPEGVHFTRSGIAVSSASPCAPDCWNLITSLATALALCIFVHHAMCHRRTKRSTTR